MNHPSQSRWQDWLSKVGAFLGHGRGHPLLPTTHYERGGSGSIFDNSFAGSVKPFQRTLKIVNPLEGLHQFLAGFIVEPVEVEFSNPGLGVGVSNNHHFLSPLGRSDLPTSYKSYA